MRIGRNGFFVRGDVNTDTSLNLTDPVFILDHLFAGGDEPQCLDAADADDNGQMRNRIIGGPARSADALP